jgi:RNA methyltransferase, TrmH family
LLLVCIAQPKKGKTHSNRLVRRNTVRLLTLARDLRRRKARDRNALFVVEGVRAGEELARSALRIVGALTSPQLTSNARGTALRDALTARNIEVTDVTAAEFESASETETPQGILIIAEIPRRALQDYGLSDPARVLVLDGIQDPGNVGTLVRTAAALGATATVALPGTVDLWNAKVVRSAMGAHFFHPALHCTWDELRLFLDGARMPLWGADARGKPVDRATAPRRLALAVGNEGSGLSDELRRSSPHFVALPLADSVESLNVAVAAGILLYELRP